MQKSGRAPCSAQFIYTPWPTLDPIISHYPPTMLSAPSPYSPFFTSGLLFEGFLPSSSPCVEEVGPRRGSLPNDMPPTHCGTSQRLQSPSDVSSAFYFTLQPRRDTSALRSFLSLDLAESQSIRTASLRRSDSTVTKTTRSSRTYVPHHSTYVIYQCCLVAMC
jgi:hypothetical protein